jgi:endoglucanase
MTRHEFLAKPAKVLRLTQLPKAARVAGTFILAGAGMVSMGMAPSFSNSKEMGSGIANPNPIANERLYVDPASNARRQADQWRTSRPDDAEAIDIIARQPQAIWINEWAGDPERAVKGFVAKSKSSNALPVFVAYNIPNRDCGQYSAGGAQNSSAYKKWIRGFAAGLKGQESVVVLEPDAVAGGSCLNESQKTERYDLLHDAIQVLKSAGASVYLDAGNPNWVPAKQMSERLNRAGIAEANGFALNVSNYYTNQQNISYGEQISRSVGGKHFIIDTSRNGNGSSGGQWCNPKGRAIGIAPTARTNHALVDAFLWIKRPGESDGTCSGGPKAGKWWGDYALGLAKSQPVALARAN